MFSARELEEQFLAPVRTLSRGTPTTGDRRYTVVASKIIILIFGILYLGLLAVFSAHLIDR